MYLDVDVSDENRDYMFRLTLNSKSIPCTAMVNENFMLDFSSLYKGKTGEIVDLRFYNKICGWGSIIEEGVLVPPYQFSDEDVE